MSNEILTTERKSVSPHAGKLGQRRQVMIPKDICEDIGLEIGDFVEVRQIKGTAVVMPSKRVEDNEILTPRQRAYIDARLAKAMANIKHGRVSPAFSSGRDLVRYLNRPRKMLKNSKTKR